MFRLSYLLLFCAFFTTILQAKTIEDFNRDWLFTLSPQQAAHQPEFDHSQWQTVNLPHDWAVELPYTNEDAAASSGFKAGGIGWYRKNFNLSETDHDKRIWLEFDGIYNNSDIWINGHHVGGRPYGYTSFNLDITDYLNFGTQNNVVAVSVNRTAYADSRWYTGSGIYRHVRLVKANVVHIPQWGIQITTPTVSSKTATIQLVTTINTYQGLGKPVQVQSTLMDPAGHIVSTTQQTLSLNAAQQVAQQFTLPQPNLWSLSTPQLYNAKVEIISDGQILDTAEQTFGIRNIHFDANKGFFLNDESIKIKGVNLHHDAGAVGVAVDKSIWRSRLAKLQAVGVNAIRLSHNPHSPDLLDLCDEMGILVNAEIFDEWDRAKDKSKVRLGDNQATGDSVKAYNQVFNQWAERDVKALVRRDFNHPAIIMWSIGNEIEWTYKYYPKSAIYDVKNPKYYQDVPIYDQHEIRNNLALNNPDKIDNLAIIAKQLSQFVKEVDTSRPVTSGLVHPSVGFASGYTDALDAVGFNYRAHEYEIAHKNYPDAIIYGSENWGAWSEWRDVKDKDYVAGIFIWTGFAYKGESGPLPKMGLEISLFDFIGNKTPRGHFFETLWVDKPKIWLGTTPLTDSEFSLDANALWHFTARDYPAGVWAEIRKWEWYNVSRVWKYNKLEPIVVQSYTNTEEAELYVNGQSMGRLKLADFADRVIKWLIPYTAGKIKVVGYNQNQAVTEDSLATHGEITSIQLTAERTDLVANGYDTVFVHASLYDKEGNLIPDSDADIDFSISGAFGKHYVDNGSEFNIGDVLAKKVKNHLGRAAIIIQTSTNAGLIKVTASIQGKQSKQVLLTSSRR